MQTLGKYLGSSVGRKQIMGLSGIYLYFFLLIHLVGNFGLFTGPEYFNQYAHLMLSTLKKVVIPIEFTLLAAFILHVVLGGKLTQENRAARASRYAVSKSKAERSPFSKMMAITGVWMLLFVIVHVPHFRFGLNTGNPTIIYEGVEMRDIYTPVMESFAKWWFTLFYVATFIAIFSHLAHGVQSSLQSLGLNHPRYNGFVRKASLGYAALITVGFSVIAIWAFLKSGGL